MINFITTIIVSAVLGAAAVYILFKTKVLK